MKIIKLTLSILLIIGLLASTALIFSSCNNALGGSDFEFEPYGDGESYMCVGFKEGKSAAEAVIPDTYKGKPVTAIANRAFSENAMLGIYQGLYGGGESEEKVPLTSVTIPASVTKIGSEAFSDCTELKTYNLPEGLVSIGANAFLRSGISGEVKIPDSVTTIGEAAFSATDITSATLPVGLTAVPASLFRGCNQLSSITMSDSVTAIGEGAFYGCEALTSFTFPASLTEIGNEAFGACIGLREVNIPTTITTLGSEVFTKTSEELVVNVSYDNERPEGWSEYWFGGMKGKALNTSEAYYNNVVLAQQAEAESLTKQLESYQSQYDSYTSQIESTAERMRQLQGQYSINPPDSILEMISDLQKEINQTNMSRSEVSYKMSEVEEQLKAYKLTNQLN